MGFAALSTEFLHGLQIDNEAPVHPHELRRIKPQRQIANAQVAEVVAVACQHPGVMRLRLQAQHIAGVHKRHFLVGHHGNA